MGGRRGWSFTFSNTLVSRFSVNVGITSVETRGETHSTHSVPSAVLDLPNFGCRRFEYPIFGCFFQVLAWPVRDPRVFQAFAKGLNTRCVLVYCHYPIPPHFSPLSSFLSLSHLLPRLPVVFSHRLILYWRVSRRCTPRHRLCRAGRVWSRDQY